MSTFSNWNGPQGSNVRATDLIELANAYSNLATQLSQHMNAHIDDAGATVHGLNLSTNIEDPSANKVPTSATVATVISALKQDIQDIENAIEALRLGTIKPGVENNVVYRSQISTSIDNTPSDNPVSETAVKNYVDGSIANIDPAQFDIAGSTLPSWAAATTDSINAVTGLVNDIAAALSYDQDTGKIGEYIAAVVAATDYIKGVIHADTAIDFTKDAVVAARNYVIDDTSQASDEPKALYILGELSELWDENGPEDFDKQKSATVFVKMTNNDRQFNLIANVTATETSRGVYNGAISVTASLGNTGLSNLTFYLISGSHNNEPHVYVAMSSTDWASDYALNAVTNIITFQHVSGINFIPATYENTASEVYPAPARAPYDNNDQAIHVISKVKVINGFSASAIVFDALNPESVNTNEYNNANGKHIITYNNGTIIIGDETNPSPVKIVDAEGNLGTIATAESYIGQIVLWPRINANGVAENVPSGYYTLTNEAQSVTQTNLYGTAPDANAKWQTFCTKLGEDPSSASVTLPAMTGGIIRIE
jgi:hypothetical protein